MSRERPRLGSGERPVNTVVLLREAFVALNERVIVRLAEEGHGAVRPAHSAVFEHLDDTGTPVARLAERAQMTKQAMAELVRHLEAHDYVARVPDPGDSRVRRARLTDRGRRLVDDSRSIRRRLDDRLTRLVGDDAADAARRTLVRLLDATGEAASVTARRAIPPSE